MKKLLMVTYSFPPKGGGGVLRQLKFAKYLPEFGWQPFILTGGDFWFFQDEDLLKELPQTCRVFRCPVFDPRFFMRKIKKRNIKSGRSDSSSRVIKWLNKITVPDIYLTWVLPAVRAGLKIARENKIDAIYSVDNPQSNHLAALILKKKTKLPWLADFKDPWSNNQAYRYEKIPPLKFLDRRLERAVVNHSDILTAVNEFVRDNCLRLCRLKDRSKFHLITNGYDRQDFSGIAEERTDRAFTITYAGTLYRDFFPRGFFRALEEVVEEGIIPAGDVRFRFLGAHEFSDTRNDEHYRSLLRRGIIEEQGLTKHKDCIGYMVNSDILLLGLARAAGSDYILSSKSFEYLASGTTILALGYENSALEKLISGTGAGKVIDYDKIESIKQELGRLYQLYLKDQLPRFDRHGKLANFERKNLTAKLVNLLDEAVANSELL